jgi:hypothetical protein
MKFHSKELAFAVVVAALLGFILGIALSAAALASASTVTPIFGGGTGTSTAPTNGQTFKADSNGNWEYAAAGGSGTVTSVQLGTPNSSLTITGTNPVTTSGTINADINTGHANTWSALQWFTQNASTSQLTATSTVWFTGYSSAALTVDSNGKLTAYGGASCTNQALTALSASLGGTCTTITNSFIANSTIDLTAKVTGTLPIANGGTNASAIASHMVLAFNGTSVVATSTPTFAAIFATSTATSTFAGGVGVGTSTPFSQFSIGKGGTAVVAENAIATSTSQTVDWNQGAQQLLQIGTAGITVTFQNYIVGQTLRLVVCNPRSGTAGTLTWPNTSVLQWAGATAPTQTTTANQCDVYSFIATQATSTAATALVFGAASTGFK